MADVPSVQVRDALRRARATSATFDEAWPRAVNGEVCDAYESARARSEQTWPHLVEPDGPPGLRTSDGATRCAGCRFVDGMRCALFDVEVFPGVRWPHRTAERDQWREAIEATKSEWRAAYVGEQTPVAALLAMLAAAEVAGLDANAQTEGRGIVAA